MSIFRGRALSGRASTDDELEREGQVGGVEDGHRADVWQLLVDVRHRGSETTDYSLDEVEVRKEQKISPMVDGPHLVPALHLFLGHFSYLLLLLWEWLMGVRWCGCVAHYYS